MDVVVTLPVATGPCDLQRTSNRDLTLQHLADAYMASYTGRDRGRNYHLTEWKS